MRERIKAIMQSEKMTPARFADSLHIGRAVISHILNGRNNPSLDVITRILTNIPNINSDWLLTGIGNMYKTENTEKISSKNLDNDIPNSEASLFSLFAENAIDDTPSIAKSKYGKDSISTKAEKEIEGFVNERNSYKEKAFRKIKQIIICYNDNTFETFGDK